METASKKTSNELTSDLAPVKFLVIPEKILKTNTR